jgi:lactate dehydrogenase-like 2-hydroxyacid dehydrogenase
LSVTDSSAKILFLTERSPRHQADALRHAPANCNVVMLRHSERDQIMNELEETEFLVSERAGVIDAEYIDAAPRLRLIQRLGTLAHDIDLGAARTAGVPVCIWPVMGCVMVAEHMVLQMLALVKRLPEVMAIATAAGEWGVARRTDENVFAYNWSQRPYISGIAGKSIGIVGFGEIGAELARRLRPFGPEVVRYYKRQPLHPAAEQALGLVYAPPDQIYAMSDFLCVLLPYSAATDLSIGAQVFERMQAGALLVHSGSGSVIDEGALAAAIASAKLGGAALDTYEWEPLRSDNPLLPLARDPRYNVLLTPHTAAGAGGSHRRQDYANIQRVLAGEEPLNRVN